MRPPPESHYLELDMIDFGTGDMLVFIEEGFKRLLEYLRHQETKERLDRIIELLAMVLETLRQIERRTPGD